MYLRGGGIIAASLLPKVKLFALVNGDGAPTMRWPQLGKDVVQRVMSFRTFGLHEVMNRLEEPYRHNVACSAGVAVGYRYRDVLARSPLLTRRIPGIARHGIQSGNSAFLLPWTDILAISLVIFRSARR